MNNGFITAGHAIARQLVNTAQQHPKRIAAALAVLLMTAGGGAFAVAQLGPNPADMPVHTVEYSVPSLASEFSIADLVDGPGFSLYRTDEVRGNDTPESLLRRLGVADPAAAAFIRSNAKARAAIIGKAGRQITAETTNTHELTALTVRWAGESSEVFQRFTIRKNGRQFDTITEFVPLSRGTRLAGGVIRSSLYASTDAANIPDNVANQMADVFGDKIDFRRALRPGDRFSLVYETLEADGEILRSGRLLSAEFRNNGKTHEALWFQPSPKVKGDYYNFAGDSNQRTYIGSPVKFTRVSSAFAMRLHPIHKTWSAHKGTDLAAPQGTPVRTVGDGVVTFAGVQNGYGNVIYIDHGNKHETVYAHLSRIEVKQGEKVSQGEEIGAVGQTGWATGPHLHFEFRVAGDQVDPLAMVANSETNQPINKQSRPAFDALSKSMRLALNTQMESLAGE
ncbi:M23 family metallopeptidase [Comamonas odontotermitis]|uniref:M23 family metallopeptidase n=1 Tax=Comamonas odontotermitis TaxID=379895 RepID=UPI001CC5DB48|nr:M23 family metallopeptidase [Comamonas odontotermitis]UBB16709.1 M23 family metallopeptidase [Comamonas odontotermitis]